MSTALRRPPHGWLRIVFRLPLWLYRCHLGWLLGRRFVFMEHRGRTSGQIRQVVLEVVRADPTTQTIIIASGYGEQSQWFRNIMHTPEVRVTCGTWHGPARAVRLDVEQATNELRDYARRHPVAFRELARFMTGVRLHGTDLDAQCHELARQVPLVALHAA